MLPTSRRRAVAIVPVIATLALVLAACNGGGATPTAVPTSPPTPSPTAVPTPTSAPTPTPTPAPRAIADIVDLLRPSVVHIQTEAVRLDQFNRPVPAGGVGTGEIIDEEGLILTNNHVIAGARRILVTLSDGHGFEAELIGGDAILDLAVIRIDAKGLVPIPIGSSSNLRVGDMVIAIGHALDLPGGPTASGGWVSALDRSIDISETITMRHLIQTDAAINPGNSGGPLLNDQGEMVGINTAKIQGGEGISFAIAIDPAKPLIKELIARGKIDRGFLGVSAVNITEVLAMNNGLPVTSGVGVISVAPGGPAEQAGLRVGDIIVGLAGNTVANVAELDGILIQYRKGTAVTVEFYRGNERRTVNVTLGERPR